MPNYDEITRWYLGWKSQISESLLQHPTIKGCSAVISCGPVDTVMSELLRVCWTVDTVMSKHFRAGLTVDIVMSELLRVFWTVDTVMSKHFRAGWLDCGE